MSFAQDEPPEFDSFVATWRTVTQQYGMAQLKVVARRSLPTKANWKLVLENFRECYHCSPSHSRSYRAVHGLFDGANPVGPASRSSSVAVSRRSWRGMAIRFSRGATPARGNRCAVISLAEWGTATGSSPRQPEWVWGVEEPT